MKNTEKLHSLGTLIVIFAAFIGISAFIGINTSPTGGGWYESLNHADITPPNWVFGVIWPILYTFMAISFWLLWKDRADKGVKLLLAAFALHMLFNWSWSFVFFEFQMIFEAFILLLFIAFYASILTIAVLNKNFIAGLLLIPYLIWLAYANYLSGYIFLTN